MDLSRSISAWVMILYIKVTKNWGSAEKTFSTTVLQLSPSIQFMHTNTPMSCHSVSPSYLHMRVDLVEGPWTWVHHWSPSLVHKITKFRIACVTNSGCDVTKHSEVFKGSSASDCSTFSLMASCFIRDSGTRGEKTGQEVLKSPVYFSLSSNFSWWI